MNRNFTKTPNAMYDHAADLELTFRELALLGCIFRHWYGDGWPRVSYERLAQMLGCGYSTVRKWTEKLEKQGLLKRVYGQHRSVTFDLSPLLEKLAPYSSEVSHMDNPLSLTSERKEKSLSLTSEQSYRSPASTPPTPPLKVVQDSLKKTERVQGDGGIAPWRGNGKHPGESLPEERKPIDTLIHHFQNTSGRAAFTPAQQARQQVPAIKEDAQALISTLGLQGAQDIIAQVVSEHRATDPLGSLHAAITVARMEKLTKKGKLKKAPGASHAEAQAAAKKHQQEYERKLAAGELGEIVP